MLIVTWQHQFLNFDLAELLLRKYCAIGITFLCFQILKRNIKAQEIFIVETIFFQYCFSYSLCLQWIGFVLWFVWRNQIITYLCQFFWGIGWLEVQLISYRKACPLVVNVAYTTVSLCHCGHFKHLKPKSKDTVFVSRA